jgi:hypothetical protein
MKSEGKLQRAHNDYVCSLHEASLHQKHYVRTTLPDLLEFQQTTQQTLITQWCVSIGGIALLDFVYPAFSKEILEEYVEFTDHSSEEYVQGHQNMQKAISNIKAVAEYDDFLDKFR